MFVVTVLSRFVCVCIILLFFHVDIFVRTSYALESSHLNMFKNSYEFCNICMLVYELFRYKIHISYCSM